MKQLMKLKINDEFKEVWASVNKTLLEVLREDLSILLILWLFPAMPIFMTLKRHSIPGYLCMFSVGVCKKAR